jgi:hypothetical protein
MSENNEKIKDSLFQVDVPINIGSDEIFYSDDNFSQLCLPYALGCFDAENYNLVRFITTIHPYYGILWRADISKNDNKSDIILRVVCRKNPTPYPTFVIVSDTKFVPLPENSDKLPLT